MTMTRRERCLTALSGGIPDRPPISFDIKPAVPLPNVEAAYRHFGAANKQELYPKAGIDGFSVWEWNAVESIYRGRTITPEADFWGNHYPDRCGLSCCDTVEHLQNYPWPRVQDFDFSHIPEKALQIQQQDMVVAAGHIGIGYQMHAMIRGNENSFLDFADPEYMECLVSHLVDFTADYITALLEAGKGKIDVVRADEDMGTMDRLLISPHMWREYYKPGFKRIFEIVHSYKAKVWLHSCGYIAPLLEDFIELDADCWNPLPPYVKGNEPENIKRICSGKIALDGGISHKILISGTKYDVKNETQRVLDTFAPNGGLLIGPSQVLTEDMPAENIIELFKTALEYQ